MSASVSPQSTDVLQSFRREAAALRLRLFGLTLSGLMLVAGSIIAAFGAFGLGWLLRAATGLGGPAVHIPLIVFVLGLCTIIGAGVTLLRLSAANERAGAADRLLEGRSRLRSVRLRRANAVTRVNLVFEDGHRADFDVDDAGAEALRAVIDARSADAPYRSDATAR